VSSLKLLPPEYTEHVLARYLNSWKVLKPSFNLGRKMQGFLLRRRKEECVRFSKVNPKG
jgi:hypothetical protein